MYPSSSSPLREEGQLSNWHSEADIPIAANAIAVFPISSDDSRKYTMITVSEPPSPKTDSQLNDDFQTVIRKQKRKKPSTSPPEITEIPNSVSAMELKNKPIILSTSKVKDH